MSPQSVAALAPDAVGGIEALSIRRKLAIAVVVLITPLIVLGVVSFRLAGNAIREEVEGSLSNAAGLEAARIGSRFEALVTELAQPAEAVAGDLDPEELLELYEGSSFESVTLLDGDARYVVASSGDSEALARALDLTRDTGGATGGVDSSVPFSRAGGDLAVAIRVPVDNSSVGWAVGETGLQPLLASVNRSGSDDSAEFVVYAMDEADLGARRLTSDSVSAPLPGGEVLGAVREVARGSEPAFYSSLDDPDGALVMAAAPLSGLDWVVAAQQARSEAYHGVETIGQNLALAFIATIIGLALIVLVVSRSITSRLRRIETAAVAIQAGDLQTRIEDESSDELGSLAKAFDGMADSLAYRQAEQVRERDRLERFAYSDPVTGLRNRPSLLAEIEKALARSQRRGTHLAVLFLDLDGFKQINDTVGHAGGDELLRMVGARLEACMRAEDSLARWGGDEFVVLCEEIERVEDATAVADRLIRTLTEPFVIDGVAHRIRVSIGIAFGQGMTSSSKSLIRDSDEAMYTAKQLGRNRYEVRAGFRRMPTPEQIDDLRRALRNDEFTLLYQPVVELTSRRTVAAEALVRWDQQNQAGIGADSVVSVAVGAGLAAELDAWVLDQSLAQLAQWRRDLPAAAHLQMSVNLTAEEVLADGLADRLTAALERHGVPPEALSLEIDAGVLDHDRDLVRERLEQVARLGVALVLEDDHMGSRITVEDLSELPLRAVKLDRVLVRALEEPLGLNVISDMLTHAERLGLDVIAEGVETPGQMEGLIRLGCRLGQGHQFAHPVPPGEFSRQLPLATRT